MNALLGKQNPLTGKASGPTITEIIDTSDSVGKGSKKDEKNKNGPPETNAARNASQSKKPQQQSAAKIDQNNGKCKKTASTETFSNKKNKEIQTETSADEIEAMIKKEDKSVGDYINPIFQQNDDCFRYSCVYCILVQNLFTFDKFECLYLNEAYLVLLLVI